MSDSYGSAGNGEREKESEIDHVGSGAFANSEDGRLGPEDYHSFLSSWTLNLSTSWSLTCLMGFQFMLLAVKTLSHAGSMITSG